MLDNMVSVTAIVKRSEVDRVLCNRTGANEVEEFLIEWKAERKSDFAVLSWQSLPELHQCLDLIQDYLENIKPSFLSNHKRESPENELDDDFSSSNHSPVHEARQASFVLSTETTSASSLFTEELDQSADIDVYNGIRRTDGGFIRVTQSDDPNVIQVDIQQMPTLAMRARAAISSSARSYEQIRLRFNQNLRDAFSDEVRLVNDRDKSSPPLRFQFISTSTLGDRVYKADPETTVGCQQCSPHMGRDIGCENTRKCDCLEYAAVDEGRLDATAIAKLRDIEANGGSTMGFPKRFPYHASGASVGCLVSFYLEARHVIYECNKNCKCGPICNNRNVQYGRKVTLEIFKTHNRGFGLRCTKDLRRGQFIDTYRGEILHNTEATRRETQAGHLKSKDSYLFSLDKFEESQGLNYEDIYVVDGEYVGGPTRFMNHSCEPNCRMFCVSYNKHDAMIYDLAFFASEHIPAGTELTFDYLDKDDPDEDEELINKEETNEAGGHPTKCLCGSKSCRGFLWL